MAPVSAPNSDRDMAGPTHPPTVVVPRFVSGLFSLIAIAILAAQIPIWVAPEKAVRRAYSSTPPYGLALTQETLLFVLTTLVGVFVALVSLFTAVNPHRLLILCFAGLIGFFVVSGAYEIHELGSADTESVAYLVMLSIFLCMLLYALCIAPNTPVPEEKNMKVRLFFLLYAGVIGVSSVLEIIVPDTMIDLYFTQTATDGDFRTQMRFIFVAIGFMGLFQSAVAIYAAIRPERHLAFIFALYIFAVVIFFGYTIENHDDLKIDRSSMIGWEVAMVLFFLGAAYCVVDAPSATLGFNELV